MRLFAQCLLTVMSLLTGFYCFVNIVNDKGWYKSRKPIPVMTRVVEGTVSGVASLGATLLLVRMELVARRKRQVRGFPLDTHEPASPGAGAFNEEKANGSRSE